MKLKDIKDMPNFKQSVTNGLDSVSSGKVFFTKENLVTCLTHGAMLCVSENRRIWRCPTCNEGAYVKYIRTKKNPPKE